MERSTSPFNKMEWIGRYARALTVLGVIGFIVAIFYGGILIHQISMGINWHLLGWGFIRGLVRLGSKFLMALLAIGLASFLRYVFGRTQQLGWILRSTDKLFYIMAGLQLLESVFYVLYILQVASQVGRPMGAEQAISLVGRIVLGVIGALVWVALGLVIRKVLPVIHESRTLV